MVQRGPLLHNGLNFCPCEDYPHPHVWNCHIASLVLSLIHRQIFGVLRYVIFRVAREDLLPRSVRLAVRIEFLERIGITQRSNSRVMSKVLVNKRFDSSQPRGLSARRNHMTDPSINGQAKYPGTLNSEECMLISRQYWLTSHGLVASTTTEKPSL
jgi:hypothetical protein